MLTSVRIYTRWALSLLAPCRWPLGLLAFLGACSEGPQHAGDATPAWLVPPGQGLQLEPGGSSTWRLPPEATALGFAVGPTSGGTLELAVVPSTGPFGYDPERGTEQALEIAASTDPHPLVLPLTPTPGSAGLSRMRLSWTGAEALDLRSLQLEVARSTPAPDVLFISIDTLSAEHLSLYGYERRTSPALDAFAEGAIVFEQAQANAPWTLPSYLSQFTGLYPEGMRRRSIVPEVPESGLPYALHADGTTMAELFGANGYRTGAWVDNPWFSSGGGLLQGFEHHDDSDLRRPGLPSDSGLRTMQPAIVDWLSTNDPRPFFAFVNCLDVHTPYAVDAFDEPPFEGPTPRTPPGSIAISPFRETLRALFQAELPKGHGLSPGDRVNPIPFTDRYDEGVLLMDGGLGAFLDDLQARGLLENTIVVISSDHGEAVGEHGWYFGHAQLYQETIHVPLVLRLPGPDRIAMRIERPVELVDLLPTLVELCDLAGTPRDLDGQSLVGLFDPSGAPTPERPLFTSAWHFDGTSVRSGSLKLISEDRGASGPSTLASTEEGLALIAERLPEHFPDGPDLATLLAHPKVAQALAPLVPDLRASVAGRNSQVFDLAGDPDESTNRAGTGDVRIAELEALATERRRLDGERRQRARADGERVVELDDATRELLQELGYLDREDP